MDGWTDLSTLLRRYGLDAIYAFESRATEVGACVRGEGVFESHEQFVGDLRNVAAADSYLLARRKQQTLRPKDPGGSCQ